MAENVTQLTPEETAELAEIDKQNGPPQDPHADSQTQEDGGKKEEEKAEESEAKSEEQSEDKAEDKADDASETKSEDESEESEEESEDDEDEESEDEEDQDERRTPKMVPAWKLEKLRAKFASKEQELSKRIEDLQTNTPLSTRLKAADEALKKFAEKNNLDFDSVEQLREAFLPKEIVEFYESEVSERQKQERVEKENAKQIKLFNKEFGSEKVQKFLADKGLSKEQIELLKPKLMSEAFKFPKHITLDRVYMATPELQPRKEKHTAESSRPGQKQASQIKDTDAAIQEKLNSIDSLPDAEQAKIIAQLPLDVFEKWIEAKDKGFQETVEWLDESGRKRTLKIGKPA